MHELLQAGVAVKQPVSPRHYRCASGAYTQARILLQLWKGTHCHHIANTLWASHTSVPASWMRTVMRLVASASSARRGVA